MIDVAILGATGMIGQRFVSLLDGHPWFRVKELVASERSAGKTYGEAARWVLDAPIPAWARDMPVRRSSDDLDADVCFSAIPGDIAGEVETTLAKRGHKVFSNARAHRWDADVPLLVPEVNADHAQLVRRQGKDGFIVTNGNCSTIVLVMTLKPLVDAFGVDRVGVTTFQAVSGAGYPGVPSLDILGNVVPFIGGEEGKVESEPLKMLGRLDARGVHPADILVSATCVRVPVTEAHSMAVSVGLGRAATPQEVAEALRDFRGRPQELKLPSAPERPVHVFEQEDRPQPRRDWSLERAMAVSVGRIRKDPLFTVKYFASGSNTVRGAAGSNVLGAELLKAEGLL